MRLSNYSGQSLECRRQSQFQRGEEESAEDAENEKLNAVAEIQD